MNIYWRTNVCVDLCVFKNEHYIKIYSALYDKIEKYICVKLAPVNFHLKWRHPVSAASGGLGTEAGSYLSTRHFRGLLLPGTLVSCWHQVTRYLSLRQTLLVCLPHWPAALRARSYLLFTVLIFYSTFFFLLFFLLMCYVWVWLTITASLMWRLS